MNRQAVQPDEYTKKMHIVITDTTDLLFTDTHGIHVNPVKGITYVLIQSLGCNHWAEEPMH